MIGKRLINTGVAAADAVFTPSEHFETVTYTGNGGTQRIGGYINRGAVFNGSSSYVTTSFDLNTLTDYSISLWVLADDSKDTFFAGTLQSGTSGLNGIYIRYLTDNRIKWTERDSSGSQADITSTSTFTRGQWLHIVVTRSGSTNTLYVNGTSEGTDTNGSINHLANFTIGRAGARNITSEYLNGKIDQVRIFNKALSSSEVTTLYGETYASSTVSTTDIFSDNSGVALYQLDGNANDTGGVSGKFGSAAIFNGSSSKIVLPQVSRGSSMTLSCWVKSTNTGIHAVMLQNGAVFRLGIDNSGYATTSNLAGTNCIGTTLINDGNWHHILGIFNDGSGNKTLYVDGVLEDTETYSSGSRTYVDGIGVDNTNVTPACTIDDVRIYSDALTSTEVGYIYNNTTASIPTDNLVAYYKLDGDARDEQQLYDGTATNVTYAYDGTATNVTYQEATKFQPDLVWIKSRSEIKSHRIFDSVRGATNLLASDKTDAEATNTSTLTSFDSNGFTLGSNNAVNDSGGETYVGWCFKGGGADVLNENGSINSQVSANQDAGFSIVKYTGTGSLATVGHGLSSTPELFIIKNLDDGTRSWLVYDKFNTATNNMTLNTSSASAASSAAYNDTEPTSTVFTVNTSTHVNASGNEHIAYCFHSVDGYSKIGSYTGTGSANSIVTGFQPAFVIIKRTDSAYNWVMYDNKRDTENPIDTYVNPNTSDAETTGDSSVAINFLSNGFEISDTASWAGINASGGTYIYLAIAADPDTTTPTVEDSFDIVTYSGNSSTQSISTLDFQPDFVWTKERNISRNHDLFDSVRGANKTLNSDTTTGEVTLTDSLNSFDSNGFSLGSATDVNFSGRDYVAWCWKAGDHDDNLPQINTEGSIDSVVSVNAAAGFSIVKYTGNGSTSQQSFGHGLSSAPELVINKSIDTVTQGTNNWIVGGTTLGAGGYMFLNSTNAKNTSSSFYGNQVPDSTVVYISGDSSVIHNQSGKNFISYCFHSVDGYQKIGSYTGNGTTYNKITTGFQPRFLLVKQSDASRNWNVFDNLRVQDRPLFPNLSNAEAGDAERLSFDSDGFTWTNSAADFNASGGTYIYLAIA